MKIKPENLIVISVICIMVSFILIGFGTINLALAESRKLEVEWSKECKGSWYKGLTNRFTIECPTDGEFEVVKGKEFIPGLRSTGNAYLAIKDMDCSVTGVDTGETILVCRGLEAEADE